MNVYTQEAGLDSEDYFIQLRHETDHGELGMGAVICLYITSHIHIKVKPSNKSDSTTKKCPLSFSILVIIDDVVILTYSVALKHNNNNNA